jgi:integrase
MHGEPADVIAANLALAGVQPSPHLDAECLYRITDRHGAADRPLRAVEHREEAVSRGAHFAAPKANELRPHNGVVRIEQRTPVTIAHLGGPPRRVHDVGEQHRRENAIVGHVSHGSVRFEGKGLSASRVRQAHQLIGAVLKFAVKAKHLPASPADGVELPRLPEAEQRYLTHEQLHRVAVASGRLRTMVLVLGYCGLRFGEATALRVADVDIKRRRIRIRRSVTYVRKTGLVEGETKNHTSRTVPVPAFLAGLLETEIADKDDTALVFSSARSNSYLTLGQARYTFQKARAAVEGCDGVRLHDLRHTCASLAISAGANVKVVQKLLGHKSAVLTLDRYGHLFPDDLDAVADAFDTAADALRTVGAF